MIPKELKKIKKILLKKIPETDGNINYIFNNGDTLLIKALKSKNKIFIHNILRYSKVHNISNNKKYTALMYAVTYNFFDIVKILVEKYRVDIYKLLDNYDKASDIARKLNFFDIESYLLNQEKIQYIEFELDIVTVYNLK